MIEPLKDAAGSVQPASEFPSTMMDHCTNDFTPGAHAAVVAGLLGPVKLVVQGCPSRRLLLERFNTTVTRCFIRLVSTYVCTLVGIQFRTALSFEKHLPRCFSFGELKKRGANLDFSNASGNRKCLKCLCMLLYKSNSSLMRL